MTTPRLRNPGGRPSKHGARALARHLAGGTLDGRTWVAQALKSIRDDLAADRGGLESCSAAERILIERAAALSLIVQSIEHWVFSQVGVVTPDGELLSVLRKGLATHTANLARMLVALGLERKAKNALPPHTDYQHVPSANASPAPVSRPAGAPGTVADASTLAAVPTLQLNSEPQP
jgi:hypothetical protein